MSALVLILVTCCSAPVLLAKSPWPMAEHEAPMQTRVEDARRVQPKTRGHLASLRTGARLSSTKLLQNARISVVSATCTRVVPGRLDTHAYAGGVNLF